MKKEKVCDLDCISISLEVYNAWKKYVVVKVVEWYEKSGRLKNIKVSQIPDEQFRLLENGDGEIFVMMPDNIEIKLLVPKGHWDWIETVSN
jgi:hypothetical protein